MGLYSKISACITMRGHRYICNFSNFLNRVFSTIGAYIYAKKRGNAVISEFYCHYWRTRGWRMLIQRLLLIFSVAIFSSKVKTNPQWQDYVMTIFTISITALIYNTRLKMSRGERERNLQVTAEWDHGPLGTSHTKQCCKLWRTNINVNVNWILGGRSTWMV